MSDHAGLRQAIGQAMAPFWYDREDRPRPDWVGEWSYWFVSAGNHLFDVLPGHEDDPRLVRYDDWTDSPENLPPSHCHGGPRALLDLDTPRTAESRRAADTWTAYHALAERFRTQDPRELTATASHEQPLIQTIESDPTLEERFTSNPALHFNEDQETYAARHAAAVLLTPTLLTLDGRWLEDGGPDHARMFNTYLDALPGETMVVRVLYHS
ncbi:hypothetical protein [Streptomyces liangshanensis]|uniref:Uncharacterized protein n=1 Tax=Streptomyces liangshanensis TaxID=2717324 RepID=A0A6G9H071_9ACTN|nr:hypothetical protein [Streptomyces liangshanensis]QIQ03611.1 hypothetical protein HA039_15880 [Streptomyces liangshanensis]